MDVYVKGLDHNKSLSQKEVVYCDSVLKMNEKAVFLPN